MTKLKRITKKQIKEGIGICIKYGYWSKKLQDFYYEFEDVNRIQGIFKWLFNSSQSKSCKYYYLIEEYCKENNINYLE